MAFSPFARFFITCLAKKGIGDAQLRKIIDEKLTDEVAAALHAVLGTGQTTIERKKCCIDLQNIKERARRIELASLTSSRSGTFRKLSHKLGISEPILMKAIADEMERKKMSKTCENLGEILGVDPKALRLLKQRYPMIFKDTGFT